MMATVSIVFMRHEGEIRSIETDRLLRHPAHPCNTLADHTEFRELGPAHLDRQHKHRVTKGLVRRLDALGYQVILRPKLAA